MDKIITPQIVQDVIEQLVDCFVKIYLPDGVSEWIVINKVVNFYNYLAEIWTIDEILQALQENPTKDQLFSWREYNFEQFVKGMEIREETPHMDLRYYLCNIYKDPIKQLTK